MEVSSLRSVSMSRTWGMFSSTTSSSVRIPGAMEGRAEFLAPPTLIFPSIDFPPRITNLSMRARGCSLPLTYVLQLERSIFDRQTNVAVGLRQAAHRFRLVDARLQHHQGDRHAAAGRLDGEHSLLAINLAGTHQNADATLHQFRVLHVHVDHQVVVHVAKPGHGAGGDHV